MANAAPNATYRNPSHVQSVTSSGGCDADAMPRALEAAGRSRLGHPSRTPLPAWRDGQKHPRKAASSGLVEPIHGFSSGQLTLIVNGLPG